MAYLYRLFVLFIALFLSLPSLAISNDDEPGKSVPPKVRGDRSNLPHVPAIAGKPIKLPVVSPLPWSRLINPTGPDPIRFTIRASKDSIAIGEEFEITITAELLDIAPQSMFFFEEQKSFSLKVLTPEGFQQTGGSYHDLIDETLTPSNPHRSYTIRGQYHADLKSLHFTLLRGPKNATSASLYEKKKELDIFLKKNSKGDVDSIEQSANARVAKPEICRFEVVPGSLTSVNGVYKGEVRKVCSTQTDNAVSGQPNCLPGQGYCKGSSLEYHSNLCGNGLDTQYWYDISTGSLVFLGQAQNNSGFLLPLTRNYQIIIWCEPLSEIPANWLPMNIYSFDCGSAPTLRLKPISCDVANAQPLSATERVIQVVGGNYSSLDLLLGNPYNGTAVTLSASQKELVITNPNYTYVYGFYTPTITGTEACDMNLPKLNIEGISLPPRSPLQVYTNQISPACSSTTKGELSITASGGSSPYQYSTNGGITYQSSNIFKLSGSTYTVVVKDAGGCTATEMVTVQQIQGVKLQGISSSWACGSYPTGVINVEVTIGGIGTLQYSIDGGSHFQTSPNFEKLAGGKTYTILAKDEAGCQSSLNIYIGKVSEPVVSITKQDAVCYDNAGNITVQAQGGGNDNGFYNWSYSIDGTTFKENGSFPTKAGSYTVTAKNVFCNIPSTVIVKGPVAPISTTFATQPSSCSQPTGSISSISTTGGTKPYRYSLTPGIFRSATSFIFLKAGRYTLYVRDSAGCDAQFSVSIATNTGSFSVNTTVVDVPCFDDGEGSALGSVTLNASGGLPPYTYASAGGSFTNITSYSLAAGTYNFTVQDANRCQFNVDATIHQPDAVTVTAVASAIGCKGGTSNVQVSMGGGTGSYTVTVNGTSIGSATSFTARAGLSYNVQATDANGCAGVTQVFLTEPASALTAVSTASTINCYGELANLSITASGGVAPYQYSVDNGSQFSLDNLFSVGAGTYTVRVRDANGCEVALSPQTITAPAALSLTTTATNVVCLATNGSITATATGGTGPYQYKLNSQSFQTASVFSNLPPGAYLITTKDSKGCQVTKSISVSLTGSTLAVSASVQPTTCGLSNGSITLLPQGGQAPYTYSWTNGQTAATISNLSAGVYTATVTDANGCRYTYWAQVGSSQPLPINASSSSPAVVGGTLSLLSQAYDGASYEWRGPGGFVGTQAESYINQVTLAAAGSYTLTVTKDGCTSTATTLVQITNCQLDFVAGTNAVVWQCTENQMTVTVAVQGQTAGKQLQVKVDDNDWMAGPTVSVPNLGIGQHIVSIRERPAGVANNFQDCNGGSRTFNTFCAPSTLCYTITPRHSNKSLLADYTTTPNGASVRQMGYQQLDGQIWRFANTTNGYLKIVSADINNVIESDGTSVRMWADRTGYNQEWRLTQNSEGAYRVVPRTDTNAGLTIPGGSQTDGTPVVVTAYNATDNQLFWVRPATCPVPANTLCNAVGTITYERWNNIPGVAVSDLLTNPRVGQAADAAQLLTLFEAPANVADQYGARIRGTVCAPVNGDYTFWISSDDGGELYLSTDNSPLNKQRIAFTNSANPSRQYENNASQKSALVTLQKGVTYYIEAYVKEGGGEDYLSVSWQLPNRPWDRMPISGQYLSPVDACAFTVTSTPSVLTIAAGEKIQVTASQPAGIPSAGGFRWEHTQFKHLFSSATASDSARQLDGNSVWIGPQAAGQFTYKVSQTNNPSCYREIQVTATPGAFSCTCQDCDLPAVKETTNPANPIATARSRGSAGQNYVSESVYLDASGNSVSQTISYFDGLGRPNQKVSVGTAGGSSAGDVIAPTGYDAFGREPQKYLPYVDPTTQGTFRLAGAGAVQGYYSGLPGKTGTAFATLTYEASPLNRVLTQTAPGSNTPVRVSYRTNTAGEVKRLDVGTTTVSVATYEANQLYVTQTTDENQNTTTEYKDKEGRVVCKDVSGRKTLYGYDDLGQLRIVVPPLASSGLSGSLNLFDAGNDLLFAYDYDSRGRMTRKKVPGAGITSMTYDTRDRLLTSTDANNTTITTSYDDLDRVVSTQQGGTVLTQTIYDGYGSEAKSFDVTHAYGVAKRANVKGVVTSTKALILGSSTYLTSSTYYDELGRVIQTVSDNAKGGLDRSSSKLDYVGRVLESKLTTTNSSTSITVDNRTAYEQGGRVKSVCQKVSDNQPSLVAGVADATRFYWEPVARHSYNGIGELTKKTLGCGIQTNEYHYQMRGWLTQMNDPTDLNKGFSPADKHFFGMKLAYDGVGNITTWDYRNAQANYGPPYDLAQQAPYQYGFTYDNLNRLTSGNLTQQGQPKFTLGNLSYDENGNITTLNRTMGAATDRLSYAYKSNSNQLASVSDGGSSDFAQSSAYDYDGNGNLKRDDGKHITGISYNYLNLPSTVSRSSGGNISYTYSASGQKLSASFPAVASTPAKVYDYVGGLVYANNQLEFIPTAEGRVLPPGLASTTVTTGSSTSVIASNRFYRYEYHLKDHLGNLRVACRCGERQTETTLGESYEPLVVQEQHYDPFGLDLTGLNSQPGITASRFKYNGKEEQQGLGLIDYGARMYDPAVPRWLQVDPLAEKARRWSPYAMSFDNPIRFIDPDGMMANDPPGKIILVFYHGGPTGDGKIKKSSRDDTGQTGKIYDATSSFAKSQGREVIGAIIAPSLTQGPGVETGSRFLEKNYKAGDQVIIYGYSYGGDNAVNLAEEAQEKNIAVNSLLTVDSSDGPLQGLTVDTTVPGNVNNSLNIYQTSFSGASSASQSSSNKGSNSGLYNSPGSRGYPHSPEGKTTVTNVDVTAPGVTHGNVQQKSNQLIQLYLNERIKNNQ